jgi:hypothetical protein
MAVVQLSDVIVPEFYAPYGGFDSMSSTALYMSGILQQNPILDTLVAGPGQINNVPLWGDLPPMQKRQYPDCIFSELNTQPACTPVYASPCESRPEHKHRSLFREQLAVE